MPTRIHTRSGTALGLRLGLAVTIGLLACLPMACTPRESRELATAKAPMFFPRPPDAPRVQFLRHLAGADQAEQQGGLFEFIVGKQERPQQNISLPYGIAVQGGKLFVADINSTGIKTVDLATNALGQFGREGPGELRMPINVRTDAEGRLYVADTERKQVVVFDGAGAYLTEYGDGKEFRPADVIVVGDELFVLDLDAGNIRVYDLATRKLKRTLGRGGTGPGMFRNPTNLTADAEGNLYVSDMLNFRIQKLDRDGKVLMTFGGPGRTPGTFMRPKGIAVDREGLIYVVDAMTCIVQMFDPQGRPLMHFGETGTGAGRLYLPAQVVIDYDNVEKFRKYIAPNFQAEYLLFVTNQYGPNKVSVFAFGRRTTPVAGSQ